MSDKIEAAPLEDDEEIEIEEELDTLEEVDLERVHKDLDFAKRRAKTVGEPAWRRLERLREDKHFAELVCDFDDYKLGNA
jgi:hypothetical protein